MVLSIAAEILVVIKIRKMIIDKRKKEDWVEVGENPISPTVTNKI